MLQEDQSESRDETRALKEKLQEMMEREAARSAYGYYVFLFTALHCFLSYD